MIYPSHQFLKRATMCLQIRSLVTQTFPQLPHRIPRSERTCLTEPHLELLLTSGDHEYKFTLRDGSTRHPVSHVASIEW